MFFILSTGRAGSKTIARTLNQFPGMMCLHEPEPQLVEEARSYLKGELAREDLVALLRKTRKSPDPAVRYGESNQKLSFMIDALLEAFPGASFIWLVRNGLDVVASWENLFAYREAKHGIRPPDTIWTRHRVRGDEVGAMSPREWERLAPAARCCWYWSWTNAKIRTDLKALGAKWMMVRLEDLSSRVEEIASFLGTSVPAGLRVPTANRAVHKVTKAAWWDRQQRREFERYCGPLMDELYPQWRKSFQFTRRQRLRNEALSYLSYRRASGRALRKLLGWVPRPLLEPARKLLAGRGVLNYPDE